MGISIQAKTDYSSLFSSLNNGRNSSMSSLSSLLSGGISADYAAIKNGSYGKLMKAYYAKDGADVNDTVSKMVDNKKKTTVKEETSELADIRSAASSLQETSDKMVASDFEKEEDNLKNVKSFVGEYNSLVAKAGSSKASSISSKNDNLVALTKNYEKSLNEVGITIGKDNKLKLDEEAFKKADTSKVKELFQGIGSYGYSVSNQATIVDNQAAYEGLKANTYTASGSFNASASSGNIWDSMI